MQGLRPNQLKARNLGSKDVNSLQQAPYFALRQLGVQHFEHVFAIDACASVPMLNHKPAANAAGRGACRQVLSELESCTGLRGDARKHLSVCKLPALPGEEGVAWPGRGTIFLDLDFRKPLV